MIRLILTIMLSALAFVSMDAIDCVTPTQTYDSRGGLAWEMLPDVYGEVMECRGDRTHARSVPLSGAVRGRGDGAVLQPLPLLFF